MRKLLLILLATLGLVLTLPGVGNAATYTQYYDGNVFWHHTRRTVYVESHVDNARWSLGAVLYQMNYNTRLHFTLHGCDSTAPCVRVYEANYGPTGWVGVAAMSGSNNVIMHATIKFNRYYTYSVSTAALRRHVSCHEFLHGAGILPHRKSGASCLAAWVNVYPDYIDRGQLHNMYQNIPY